MTHPQQPTREVLDCPFCGMKPPQDLIDTLHPSGTYWRQEDDLRHYVSHANREENDTPCWVMNCTEDIGGCGARINGDSKQEAIDRWNRRAALAHHTPSTTGEDDREYCDYCGGDGEYLPGGDWIAGGELESCHFCDGSGFVTPPQVETAPSTAGERAELLKALSENRLNYSDQSKLAALLQSTALPVDVQERETNSVASQKHTALIDKLFMALKTARDHIDMEALALSHYKDATTIRSTIEAAKQAAHGITKKGG